MMWSGGRQGVPTMTSTRTSMPASPRPTAMETAGARWGITWRIRIMARVYRRLARRQDKLERIVAAMSRRDLKRDVELSASDLADAAIRDSRKS